MHFQLSRHSMRRTPGVADIAALIHVTRRIGATHADVVHGHVVRVVAPGKHELRAGAPGYVEYARSIDVAGRVVVDVSLTRVHRRGPTRPKAPTDGPKPLDPNATIEPF